MNNKYGILLNDKWSFCITDIDAGIDETQNGKWYNVEIPHDWLIGNTEKLYETGCGWYKRTLCLDENDLKGSIALYFEGVYMDSAVYVNGEKAYEWKYGYSSFEADITDFVKCGENEILVSVHHRSPNTRWYSGAGIFRSVWLKKRSKSHIATNGVYISARKSGINWLVEAETEVVNSSPDMYIKQVITLGEQHIAERETANGSLDCAITVNEPLLWDIDSPTVYTLTTQLYNENGLLDEVTNTFGFKDAVFDCDRGFILNGRQLKLHGVCMHHDMGALGSAVNYAAIERQLKIMKNCYNL